MAKIMKKAQMGKNIPAGAGVPKMKGTDNKRSEIGTPKRKDYDKTMDAYLESTRKRMPKKAKNGGMTKLANMKSGGSKKKTTGMGKCKYGCK
jgi:hypothetical protein